MKANPEDLKGLADDLNQAIHSHPDACQANPDIQLALERMRAQVRHRYQLVTEKAFYPQKKDDYVP